MPTPGSSSGISSWLHHDLWDFDVPAPPTLFDVKIRGKLVPGVAEFGKTGSLFLFDRTNGKPLFGMEERPVAQSTVPGERTSPTQPFPLKPPPLAPMSVSKSDIYNLTPEHAAFCKDLWEKNNLYNLGPFTPFSDAADKMAIVSPGREGSANWSGVAFDPKLGYIFGTTDFNTAQIGRLVKRDKELPTGGFYEKEYPGGGITLQHALLGSENRMAVPESAVGGAVRSECENWRYRLARSFRYGRRAGREGLYRTPERRTRDR